MNIDIYQGDALQSLKTMKPGSVDCCVTSPAYWGLRDYGESEQLGLEKTPEEYVANLVAIFKEVKRVLKDDGTLWLNLGDSYAGSGKGSSKSYNKDYHDLGKVHSNIIPQNLKAKDLVGIPFRVAFALQQDGWYLRQDIIWHKPNAMPESVKDRCTKSHEYIFLLSKSAKYYYDYEAIKEDSADYENSKKRYETELWSGDKHQSGEYSTDRKKHSTGIKSFDGKRNKRSVWTVTTKSFKEAHFAVFPPDLIEPCILAGCKEGGIVLDPFAGSGTTGLVATNHNRNAVLCELSRKYIAIAKARISQQGSMSVSYTHLTLPTTPYV